MTMWKLAWMNFRQSVKNYLSLVVSLAFTVLVFMNFQNLIYSEVFQVLGSHNKEYIDLLVQMVSFVLACFMFFFVGYATGVFLTRRKKEIGTYVFMGLSNQKIGELYSIETMLMGLAALGLGLGAGILTAGLFQMVLLALGGFDLEVHFLVSPRPVVITAVVYLGIYLFFVGKGYVNIVRSSVLAMIQAAKQNEYVRQNRLFLSVRAVAGAGLLGTGYYLAVRKGGPEVMAYAFTAMVLVMAGVYLVFGGLIPLVFWGLAGNKRFLYRKECLLWVSRVIFCMKKNYRTYAMVSILVLCSVTALAMGVAMKQRYGNMVHFENIYTFQLLSSQKGVGPRAESIIRKYTDIRYQGEIPFLVLDDQAMGPDLGDARAAILSYSNVVGLTETAPLECSFPEPGDDEVIKVSQLYLMSLITRRTGMEVKIAGKSYRQTMETSEPYLGYLQEQISFYLVSDREYERLRHLGQEQYTWNYRISDLAAFGAVKEALEELSGTGEGCYTARIAVDPGKNDTDWVRVLYPFCFFMFLVFLMASGSMMLMKVYNDALDERERCQILRRMGIDGKALYRAIVWELGTAYGLCFLVMILSSWFSVRALGNMMYTDLTAVYAGSVLAVFASLAVFCGLSVTVYWNNVTV